MQNETKYPSTKYRISNDIFKRDLALEREYGIDDIKLYCYYEDNDEESLKIVGEIISTRIKKPFCIMCTVYDHDDDIIHSSESDSYGSGLVTSMIKPESFFNRFPFTLTLWSMSKKRVKEIVLAPADSY